MLPLMCVGAFAFELVSTGQSQSFEQLPAAVPEVTPIAEAPWRAPIGGEVVAGLQLTAKEEFPAGVVHFWIRNAEDHEITYNRWGVRYAQAVRLEVQEPAGHWIPVKLNPSAELLVDNIGPVLEDNVKLAAHQVIRTDRPRVGPYLGFGHKDAPAPASWGATKIIDLAVFQWPENVLRQSTIAIRVVQEMPEIHADGSSGVAGILFADEVEHTLLSPTIQLDGAKMRSFLQTYSPQSIVP